SLANAPQLRLRPVSTIRPNHGEPDPRRSKPPGFEVDPRCVVSETVSGQFCSR
ncbi:MAG: hypothetical protein QOF90_96, partial [Acetobacteraceae bacterium]|nr:hypothetical protein [Acetobacteraceae bacterium]